MDCGLFIRVLCVYSVLCERSKYYQVLLRNNLLGSQNKLIKFIFTMVNTSDSPRSLRCLVKKIALNWTLTVQSSVFSYNFELNSIL